MAKSYIQTMPQDAIELYTDLTHMPEIKAMENFTAHGHTSVYDHSVNVTKLSVKLARGARMKSWKFEHLVMAAMLHDFYLYDYHGRRRQDGFHAWRHPERALSNAEELFDLTPDVKNAIRCHMFPGTLFHMPLYAIGWIVSIADKICAIRELIHRR